MNVKKKELEACLLFILKINMLSIINFEKFEKLEILVWENKTLLIVQQQDNFRYVLVPNKVNCLIKSKFVEISCLLKKDFFIYNTFINVLMEIKNSKNCCFKQKLFLKGLGYRCNVDLKNKILIFKIGFSNSISVDIPDYISNVIIKKTFLLFESTDKILLGNFIHKVYKLRTSDVYKGKGFSFPYKQKKLKIIKKK